MRYLTALAALAAAQFVAAHPGEDPREELEIRRQFFGDHKRNLNHCTHKLKARRLDNQITARQHELAEKLRQRRGLPKRSNTKSGSLESNDIWSKNKPSCVLAPQEVEGPYYVVNEHIREYIAEDQSGILLALGIQFIDYTTCEPVPNAWVDVWHSNSTGVYSGVISNSNGDGPQDPSNEYTTFHRGLQKTDEAGVVSFMTTFPGHYPGRAPHVHVLIHPDAEPTAEDTILDAKASYVGQMYFNQDLILEIEDRAPYNYNKAPLTLNKDDVLLQDDLQAGGFPFMEMLQAGITIESGVLGWLTFGINTSYSRTVDVVGTHHAKADLPKSTDVPDANEELK